MHRDLFIGGAWRPAANGTTIEIRDPATGDPVGTSAVATPADVDAAVASAERTFPAWAAAHADERAGIIRRAADLIATRSDRIAETLTREQGKPIPDALKEISFAIEVLRYYAEEGRRVGGSIRPSARADVRSLVTSSPIGVCGAIVPWNYPVDLYAWKIAPALAAGCTVVAKPPPETPLAIGQVIRCFAEAGLPAGVLNDLPGAADVGAAIAAHPGIRLVAATASTAAGQAIMRAAAGNLKRLSLELGGQSPFIVLADADVAEAAAAAARRSFSNMGQICIAVNRILVAEAVHGAFVEALVAETRKIRLGHGVEPGVAYGPMLNETGRARVGRHVGDAVAKGGRLLVGGGPPRDDALRSGYFFEPTLVDGVSDGALAMTEETYGPLAAIRPVRDESETICLANALPYGLAAYVYSRDLERAWAFAESLEAGAVGVNVNDTTELQAPFGGWKLSGFGSELGREGIETYLAKKHIRLRVRPTRMLQGT